MFGPGFTADASLYRSDAAYSPTAGGARQARGQTITPQALGCHPSAAGIMCCDVPFGNCFSVPRYLYPRPVLGPVPDPWLIAAHAPRRRWM
jgi:hypothetical protein